jgi:hypothetical protein
MIFVVIHVAKASFSQMSSHHARRHEVAEPHVPHLVGRGAAYPRWKTFVSSRGVASMMLEA